MAEFKTVGIRMPQALLDWLETVRIARSRSEKIRALTILGLQSLGLMPKVTIDIQGMEKLVSYPIHLPKLIIDLAEQTQKQGYFTSKAEAIRVFLLMGALQFLETEKPME